MNLHKAVDDQIVPNRKDMSRFRKAGPFVYVTGQVGLDAEGNIVKDPKKQIAQALANLDAVLKDAGVSRSDVVKLNHYMADRKYLPEVIKQRKEFFSPPYPASTGLICELALPEYIYEVEVVAMIDES